MREEISLTNIFIEGNFYLNYLNGTLIELGSSFGEYIREIYFYTVFHIPESLDIDFSPTPSIQMEIITTVGSQSFEDNLYLSFEHLMIETRGKFGSNSLKIDILVLDL